MLNIKIFYIINKDIFIFTKSIHSIRHLRHYFDQSRFFLFFFNSSIFLHLNNYRDKNIDKNISKTLA